METLSFHRTLPLDAATSADWALSSTKTLEEHAAWLRLRGFVKALMAA